MKRLYVSDLDGTLLNDKKEITPFTAKVINEFVNNGGLFSVATARTAGTVVNILKNTFISCPVILMNGAMIYDIKKEKYLKYEVIEKDEYLKIADVVKKYDINGFIYTFDGERIVAYYEKISDITLEFYNERKNSDKYKRFEKVDSFFDVSDKKLIYFALMDSYEKLSKVNEILEDINVEKAFYQDIYDKNLYYLEMFSRDANKANGVKFLKKYIQSDNVTAFGDNLNDLAMFEVADFKVAPENALDEVKKASDFICESNACDGVAKYILKEGEKSE